VVSRQIDRDGTVVDSTRPVTTRVGSIAMIGAIVSFSLSTPIVKWSGTTGVVLAFWRMWMSVGTWWIVMWFARGRTQSARNGNAAPPIEWPDRRTWKLVAPAGLLFGVNISLLFTAVTRTSIAHVEFLSTLTPLLVVPAGAFLFGERPNWSALRYAPVSIVGVAMVLFFGPESGSASVDGDLLVVVVLVCWTGYLIFTKRARAAGVDTISFMACMMPLGMVTTIPLAILLAGDEIFSMTKRGWFIAVVLALLTGMLAHGCIAFAQQHLPIATITVMQTAQPALAVLFAFLILDEAVRWLQVVGMALVIAGITAFSIASQRGSAQPSTK
jgi:drug/metabolite transporter (DMT)-like permease